VKRVLVTGATGFVGASLTRRLLRDGHDVHLVVRAEHRPWRVQDIRDNVRFHHANLASASAVESVVGTVRPDWVFHLAASGAYAWQTDLDQMIETNIRGTVNLVRACVKSGFEAFINAGSSSEYGYKDHPPREDEVIEPNSHYALTKSAATLFCQLTARSEYLKLITLRLYSVYGPWEEPTRFVPRLVLKAMHGEYPPLVHPDVARDFIFVEDVNDAFILAAARPNQMLGAIYNVGTGTQTTIRDAVAVAGRLFGIAREPDWGSMPNRSWDTATWIADNRRVREALGWSPRHSFEQGLREFVRWFQEAPRIEKRYRAAMEAGQ
jgi:nucleoside-diphosphate-sugar epimerase